MLEALRTEPAEVRMSLVRYDGSGDEPTVIVQKGGKCLPPANEFLYLRTIVTNLSRLSFYLRDLPSADE